VFRLHSSAIAAGELPWVAASGIVGARRLTIKVPDDRPRRLTLHFCEPDQDCGPGSRQFDVVIQGHKVLERLDVAKEAGGPRRGLAKSFSAMPQEGEIVIELLPHGERPTIISGLEITRQAGPTK
jgi:hypothetical protein